MHLRSGQDKALFKIENIDGNLNENAKTLTLTPYAANIQSKVVKWMENLNK